MPATLRVEHLTVIWVHVIVLIWFRSSDSEVGLLGTLFQASDINSRNQWGVFEIQFLYDILACFEILLVLDF